jgi:hypothetical protein
VGHGVEEVTLCFVVCFVIGVEDILHVDSVSGNVEHGNATKLVRTCSLRLVRVSFSFI